MMTGRTLRRNLCATIVGLLVASALTLYAGVHFSDYEEASRAFISVYIAISAGWLTFCLQRRVAYTNALRSFWERLVETVQHAIEYTHADDPTRSQFVELSGKLCCRIDEVRGVFRNVGEMYEPPKPHAGVFVRKVKQTKDLAELAEWIAAYGERTNRGVYPFESIKQMYNVIQRLGYGKLAERQAESARGALLVLWGILRTEILKELDRDFPEFPDTPYMQNLGASKVKLDVLTTGLRTGAWP